MTDKTELRGLCPSELAQALDAIAMTHGLDRNAYVIMVLEAEVKKVAHAHMMLARTLKGNPYLVQGERNE